MIGEVIGGRGLDRAPGGGQGPSERIGPDVVPVRELFHAEHREHRPGVRMTRRLRNGPLQGGPRDGVLLHGDALDVAEAAQHRLVRTQLAGVLAPDRFAHAVRQDAV